jgi:hypothetical protein
MLQMSSVNDSWRSSVWGFSETKNGRKLNMSGRRENIHVGRAAQYLVAAALRPIVLEIESEPGKAPAAARKYSIWINQELGWQQLSQGGHAKTTKAGGKFSSEWRIYFRKHQPVRTQMERYSYLVENGDVRHRGTFRINSQQFFEELVRNHGLRLGENH